VTGEGSVLRIFSRYFTAICGEVSDGRLRAGARNKKDGGCVMEKALPYAEMLRRKAQKKRALAAGEAEQERLTPGLGKPARPAMPKVGPSQSGTGAVSSVKMVKRAPSGALPAGGAATRPASPPRAASHGMAHPQAKPAASTAAEGSGQPIQSDGRCRAEKNRAAGSNFRLILDPGQRERGCQKGRVKEADSRIGSLSPKKQENFGKT
jgi:hypothetical protein